MKAVTTKPGKIITPETADGACFSGLGMTKKEAAEMEQWVKDNKVKKEKSLKRKSLA